MKATLIPENRIDEYIKIAGISQHADAIKLGKWTMQDNSFMVQLPRFMDSFKHHPDMLLLGFKDESKSADINFLWKLRDYQVEPMDNLKIRYNLLGSLSGVIHARPGSGKTVMAAYVSSFIKKKVLVVLDNSTLVSQWEDAFLNATTVKSIGKIQGDIFDVDHDVTIAMVQTLMNRAQSQDQKFMDEFRLAGFGIALFDEAHKSACAEKYAKSTILMNRIPNLIGLTATLPVANSTHEFMLTYNIGPVICSMEGQDDLPHLTFINYRSALTKKQSNSVKGLHNGWFAGQDKVKGDYIKAVAKYDSLIAEDPIYLEIISDASNFLISKGHRVIIITKTVKQIGTIIKAINDKYPSLNPVPFHAKEPIIDRTQDTLIVATQKKASAGFDYKELSALILATPMKGKISLIQTGGRILRTCDNKVAPVIYDLIDHNVPEISVNAKDTKANVFLNEYGDKVIIKNYNHKSITNRQ